MIKAAGISNSSYKRWRLPFFGTRKNDDDWFYRFYSIYSPTLILIYCLLLNVMWCIWINSTPKSIPIFITINTNNNRYPISESHQNTLLYSNLLCASHLYLHQIFFSLEKFISLLRFIKGKYKKSNKKGKVAGYKCIFIDHNLWGNYYKDR